MAVWAICENLPVAKLTFGDSFDRPTSDYLALAVMDRSEDLPDAAEFRDIMSQATAQHRATFLLAMNAGYQSIDIGEMTLAMVNGFELRSLRTKRVTARAVCNGR